MLYTLSIYNESFKKTFEVQEIVRRDICNTINGSYMVHIQLLEMRGNLGPELPRDQNQKFTALL